MHLLNRFQREDWLLGAVTLIVSLTSMVCADGVPLPIYVKGRKLEGQVDPPYLVEETALCVS